MTDTKYALIPAYKPDQRLIAIAQLLKAHDFHVIIIDDGSGKEYTGIFSNASPYADILRQETNRGKGMALKTGLKALLKEAREPYIVVTLDADGQHSIEDTIRVAKKAFEHKDALILGTRGFDTQTPIKSRLGNDITRGVFSLVTGTKIQDTQTGLRAFSDKHVKLMTEIEGSRYEYEINVLLEYAKQSKNILEIPIKTIYLDDNKSSHFHAVRDSFLIYMKIFKHIHTKTERRGTRC